MSKPVTPENPQRIPAVAPGKAPASKSFVYAQHLGTLAAWLSLVIPLSLTSVIWSNSKRDAETSAQKEFAAANAQIVSAVTDAFANYEQGIRGTLSLFNASGEVSRQSFHVYTENLLLDPQFAGMRRIAYAQIVPQQERVNHVGRVRAEGYPGYDIKPAGERPVYAPAVLMEPFSGGSLRSFGYDMYSEPVRREAMQRARDSGLPQLSGRIELVTDMGMAQPAYILIAPHYRGGVMPKSPEARRENIEGFVLGAFRVSDLMQGIAPGIGPGIELEIFESIEPARDKLIYASGTGAAQDGGSRKAAFAVETPVRMAGQTWTVRATAGDTFMAAEKGKPLLILAGGIAISLVLFAIAIVLSRTRQRALELAGQMNTSARENEEKLRAALEAAGMVTWDCELAGGDIAWGTGIESLLGPRPPEGSYPDVHDMIHGDNVAAFRATMQRLWQRTGPHDVECRVMCTGGRVRWLRFWGRPVEDDANRIVRLTGLAREITARKEAEIALQESRQQLDLALGSGNIGLWDLKIPENRLFVDERMANMLGYTKPQIDPFLPDSDRLIHPDDLPRVQAARAAHFKGETALYSTEHRMRTINGVWRWVLSNGIVMERDATGRATRVVGVCIDIHARKRVEVEIREARQFLETIVENIPNMVFVKNAYNLHFVSFNRAGEELLGRRREDMVGKSDYDFFPADEADFFTAHDRTVIASGKMADIDEEPIHTPRGLRYLRTRKLPIMDEEGKAKFLLGISEDITERKEAEEALRKLNRDLAQQTLALTAANDELESFAYTVSHDLRAPLRHIAGFMDLFMTHAGGQLDETAQRYARIIAESASHMGRLIDDLLLFSRMGRTALNKQRLNPDAMVAEIVNELTLANAGRGMEWKVAGLPEIDADAGLIRQVFYNLIENAVKYSGKREHALIEIGVRHDEELGAVFYVRDNGAGFDMRYQEKLFGVFQRLHSADEFTGTGIGLANVARIVERHGGRAWAEGAVDKGATFYFSLPAEA